MPEHFWVNSVAPEMPKNLTDCSERLALALMEAYHRVFPGEIACAGLITGKPQKDSFSGESSRILTPKAKNDTASP